MTIVNKKKSPPANKYIDNDASRFEKYAKSPYFIEKNKRAEELIKKAPIPDWMKK